MLRRPWRLHESYPELSELTTTDPVELAPGDATAHTMYTIHGTDANETASLRWALIVAYIPDRGSKRTE